VTAAINPFGPAPTTTADSLTAQHLGWPHPQATTVAVGLPCRTDVDELGVASGLECSVVDSIRKVGHRELFGSIVGSAKSVE